jgi:hypothetical protein
MSLSKVFTRQPTIAIGLTCLGLGITGWYYTQRFLPTYSYHITKSEFLSWPDSGFGDYAVMAQQLAWWPLSGFGHYCTSRKLAEVQFQKEIKGDPHSEFKLIRARAIKNVFGRIVGISGPIETIQSSKSNK